MSPTIRIDDDVFKALQRRATAFVDTPNDVLRRLLKLRNAHPRRDRRVRAPVGSVTASRTYRPFILRALQGTGGSASIREVLGFIEREMKGRFKPRDLERLTSSGELVWRNKAQWERHEMVKEGLLEGDSLRGIWELTSTGRAEAQKVS